MTLTSTPLLGEVWYNKNMARTFRELGAHGKDGFYKVGSYLIVILQYNSTTLYQVSHHIQSLFF
jgi:gamma-glutamyltranspeptidase